MNKLNEQVESILENTLYIIVGLFGSGLVLGFFVMFLWNKVIPHIFNLPMLGYFDSLWLYMLSGLLVKSISINRTIETKKD